MGVAAAQPLPNALDVAGLRRRRSALGRSSLRARARSRHRISVCALGVNGNERKVSITEKCAPGEPGGEEDGGQAGETPEGSSNKTSELDKAIKTTVYRFGVAVPATLLCTYLIYGESFTKSGLFLGLDLAWTSVTYYWFEVWWHELDSNKQVITAIAFLGGTALLLFLRWWYSDAISPLLS